MTRPCSQRCTDPPAAAFVLLTALALTVAGIGCHSSSSSSSTVVIQDTGKFAGDFQSLADYLDDPSVQFLLANMPSYPGASPPDVTGLYEADGIVTLATDGSLEGLDAFADFCFGPAVDAELPVEILDPSVEAAGARSFIEGSGDLFTVYTAFRSVQTLDTNETCDIHEVNVISGRLLPDGSISELVVGFVIVGLVGRCDNLFLEDIQVSDMTGRRVGDDCGGDPAPVEGPEDPNNVLVVVENTLVVDLLVFLGSDVTPVAQIAPEEVGSFETTPGFSLEFESLQPIAGTDVDGNDLFAGEIILGAFAPDEAAAGSTSVYTIENQVGTDTFFAPLPVNQTGTDIFSVVNVGFTNAEIPGYPDAPASGLDCFCILPPSTDPFVVGYYSYDAPGLIEAADANVHFFDATTETELANFQGPFLLEEFSGAVTLRVD